MSQLTRQFCGVLFLRVLYQQKHFVLFQIFFQFDLNGRVKSAKQVHCDFPKEAKSARFCIFGVIFKHRPKDTTKCQREDHDVYSGLKIAQTHS